MSVTEIEQPSRNLGFDRKMTERRTRFASSPLLALSVISVLVWTTMLSDLHLASGFTTPRGGDRAAPPHTASSLYMGLFDGVAKAFGNQEYAAQDRRVRASHILIKVDGDDDDALDAAWIRITALSAELRGGDAAAFAAVARRESRCPSAEQGGDLGSFGPGTMVPEFDAALFPEENAPPVGALVGPVVTDFGVHVVLVTGRDSNRDQVEEKLARND